MLVYSNTLKATNKCEINQNKLNLKKKYVNSINTQSSGLIWRFISNAQHILCIIASCPFFKIVITGQFDAISRS
jgi:hypothetical protein